ncbi:MAG: acetyl-CoA carboxylase biotin carboxyl carrier protein subunit [Chromatiales bacterium]|jgi:acetyl-CoA carboxylase biotin carboxyl carrier protein|nr:acetyl-CoA carboxylase biotin carboxyl carrier protein subunit [Chromatiales bacterium]
MAIDVESEVSGTAWKILVAAGQAVEEDETLMIAESMKMEIPITAPEAGTVTEVCVEEGAAISEGDVVFKLDT